MNRQHATVETGGDITFDLARLIRPITPATFFAQHWDRRPLLVKRGDARYYQTLFTIDQLPSLIANYGARGENDIQVVKHGDGRRLDTKVSLVGTALNLDRLYAAYGDGATIKLNEVTPHHSGVRRMVHSLFAEAGLCPYPNMYLTPPASRAFDLHFDVHDVIIIQLAGAKDWRVYERIDPGPAQGHVVPRTDVGAPIISTTLESGDMLHVPRGFAHEAETSGDYSLHITVGLPMATYHELLVHMAAAAGARSVRLRATIPPGSLFGRSRAELMETMTALIDSELGESAIDDATAALAAEVLAKAPAAESPAFTALEHLPRAPLSLDDTLLRASGQIATLRTHAERVALHVPGGVVEGPHKILPALEHVARSETLRARDFPGSLSDSAKLLLANHLVREGLLRRL